MVENEEKLREERFEEKNREIVERYGSELESPEENLKVVCVVPALAELSNGNFWRLLRSLARQRGVDQAEFEVLYVVNNSQLTAERVENSLSTNVPNMVYKFEGHTSELITERYHENQKTLAIIKLIEGGDVDGLSDPAVGLSEEEKRVAEWAIKQKVRIHAVDVSSSGKAISVDDGDNAIGISRDIGGRLAYERLMDLGRENGLIDYIDGDCFLPPNYFRSLVPVAESGYSAVWKPLHLYTPEMPEMIESYERPLVRLAALINYLSNSLMYIDYYGNGLSRIDVDGKNPFSTGGPQIAVTPETFREVEGYPRNTFVEDYLFGQKVRDEVGDNVFYLEESEVYLSDRGREGSIDGSRRGVFGGGAESLENVRGGETIELSGRNADRLLRLNSKVYSDIDKAGETIGLVKEDWYKRYEDLRRYYFNLERIQRGAFIRAASVIIDQVCQVIEARREEGEIDWVEDLRSSGQLTERELSFLKMNPVLIGGIVTVAEMSMTFGAKMDAVGLADSVKRFFRKNLPEYFADPPEEELDYLNTDPDDANVRDLIHIQKAAYMLRADMTNKINAARKANRNSAQDLDGD